MKKYLIITLLTIISGTVFAQSNDILDEFYAEKEAKTSHTALILLQIAGYLDDDATLNDAEIYLENTTWGGNVLKDGEFITVGGFSLMIMNLYKEIPRGVMYRLLPSRRYATKDLIYNGYILGNPYPNEKMTSFDVIFTLSSLSGELN